MGLAISDDVSKITLGSQVLYDRNIQDSSWIECPDEGKSGDFVGFTLMKWDGATKTARFKSNANVQVPAYYTVSNPQRRLAITLPSGYHFIEDAKTAVFYDAYAAYASTGRSCNINVEGNKLYA